MTDTKLYCSSCDSFTPHSEVWNLAAPQCPECAGDLREVDPPPLMASAYLTGEVEFQPALGTYSVGPINMRVRQAS